jgi:hypothetical protein
MKKQYFECECGSDEHRFCITSEDAEDGFAPQLYFHLQLYQYRNIFKKMWVAIKYVFGYECRYGHWDTINISEDDTNRLYVLFHQHKVKIKNFSKQQEQK